MGLRKVVDYRWFKSKREAEKYAREKLGKVWKYWSRIERAGEYRNAGWNVKIYEPWNGGSERDGRA